MHIRSTYKGKFPFKCFAISEYHLEIFIKVVIKLFNMQVVWYHFEAEQYSERIMKIGWNLTKLELFKASH